MKGNNLNLYQKYGKLRTSALGIALISLAFWAVCGFDSTPLQFMQTLLAIPSVGFDLNALHGVYDLYYGKEMHYSAFVIYGLMYWALSKHFDKKHGIKGSRNVVYSACIMLLSVAFFEFYWILSYAYFQNQWWVATFALPQARILIQNIVFLIAGSMGVLYMWADSFIMNSQKQILGRNYYFNWNWISLLLISLSIASAIVWWYYPFHVTPLTVTYNTDFTWHNSPHFPQTLYTIDLNPTDSINAGEWFYVPNDAIHAWNTLVKALWTFTIFYIAKTRIKK